MLKKISALSATKELSKKEQHAINGGATNYLCHSTLTGNIYHSEDDISGDYGNGHVITCTAQRAQTSGQSRTH